MCKDSPGAAFIKRRRSLFAGVFVAACVFLVYVQVVTHDFISYDDSIYVTDNEYVKTGLSVGSVIRAFSMEGLSSRTYYHPLTWVSHMIDVQLFGLNSGMHHLVNALIHTINTILLFSLLLIATRSLSASFLTALLFGLHPIGVDSVAWLAERKNVLSATFWMLTLLAYVRYSRSVKVTGYLVVLGTFGMGLLTKSSIVALPGVLILMDFWPLKRIWFHEQAVRSRDVMSIHHAFRLSVTSRMLMMEKIPLFAMSAASVYVSTLSLKNDVVPTDLVPMTLRIENAVVACVKYLQKLIMPVDLTFFYPYPNTIPTWEVAGAAAVLLIVTLLALRKVYRKPYFLFGWLWFLGTIFPVLGIMQGGHWPQIAERWAYIPFIGIYIAVSWGVVELHAQMKDALSAKMILGAVTVVLTVLCGLTWNQVRYWKNDYLLYMHGIEVNPENYVAHNNLGKVLLEMNRTDEAIAHYRTALDLNEGFREASYNLGVAYLRKGEVDKSITLFNRAILLDPDDWEAYLSLGVLYLDKGRLDEAAEALSKSLRISSDNPHAYFNMGNLYHRKGDLEGAVMWYTKAIQTAPGYTEAHYNLGVMLVEKKMLKNAVAEFSKVIALNPLHKAAHYNLGKALSELNRVDEAIAQYESVLRIDPGFAPAQRLLVAEKGRKANLEDAVLELEKVLERKPGNPEILGRLAVYYALLGQNGKAESSQKEVVRKNPSSEAYYNLACIYAKEERVNESVESLRNAVDLGFKDWKLLKADQDLESIRSTSYYENLVNGPAR